MNGARAIMPNQRHDFSIIVLLILAVMRLPYSLLMAAYRRKLPNLPVRLSNSPSPRAPFSHSSLNGSSGSHSAILDIPNLRHRLETIPVFIGMCARVWSLFSKHSSQSIHEFRYSPWS